MPKKRIFPSFLRGLDILKVIADSADGLRLADVARAVDLAPSNTTLYLNTLLQSDFLIRDPCNQKYYISPFAVTLFNNASASVVHYLLPLAEKPMQALHDQYNENVLVSYIQDNLLVFVKHINSGHTLRIGIESTINIPPHATAAGRAILAFLPEKELNSYLKNASFRKITNHTVADENALHKKLEETRQRGFAFNPGEFEEQVMAVAAPVLVGERPVASLVVQFPLLRHKQKEAYAAGGSIAKQAQKITIALKRELRN
jgi:DNA-binding IclR family transcriptional regulator